MKVITTIFAIVILLSGSGDIHAMNRILKLDDKIEIIGSAPDGLPRSNCGCHILDVKGRLIRILKHEGVPLSLINWDGKDEGGVDVPSGVYFLKSRACESAPAPAGGDPPWEKYEFNPVLTPGPYEWDSVSVSDPCVIADEDTLKMWYIGYDGQGMTQYFGYAWSLDEGLSWEKYPDSVFERAESWDIWDGVQVYSPYVVREDGAYKMWYTGVGLSASLQVGYAVSEDGVSWDRYEGNPIFPPQEIWATDIWDISAIHDVGEYGIWFRGLNFDDPFDFVMGIGYAVSADEVSWVNQASSPVLMPGDGGEWDEEGIYSVNVIKEDDVYNMWYSAGLLGEIHKIGHATSPNGTTWTKDASNPVLQPYPGQWDEANVSAPSILPLTGKLRMWYEGIGGNGDLQIGVATQTFTGVSDEDGSGTSPVPRRHTTYLSSTPNPFNPRCTIRYSIPDGGEARLAIFDQCGKMIRRLLKKAHCPGTYQVVWNGKDESGSISPTGVYFCTLDIDGRRRETVKLLLLK